MQLKKNTNMIVNHIQSQKKVSVLEKTNGEKRKRTYKGKKNTNIEIKGSEDQRLQKTEKINK